MSGVLLKPRRHHEHLWYRGADSVQRRHNEPKLLLQLVRREFDTELLVLYVLGLVGVPAWGLSSAKRHRQLPSGLRGNARASHAIVHIRRSDRLHVCV